MAKKSKARDAQVAKTGRPERPIPRIALGPFQARCPECGDLQWFASIPPGATHCPFGHGRTVIEKADPERWGKR